MDPESERDRFEFGLASDAGRKRRGEPNQDSAAVVLPAGHEPWHPPLLLVADGLGRYQGGALASQTAVRVFTQVFKQSHHPAEYPVLLASCVQAAHAEIRALGAGDASLGLMGSTLVAVILEAGRLFILNVGDSRAYLLDGATIRQVSQDHSWAAVQMRAGVLTEAEARVHPNRNRLLMAITAKRTKIEYFCAEQPLRRRDVVLLCSDGLWGVVPETLIRATAFELSPQAAAAKLVSMANSSSGPDNISVVIARRSAGPHSGVETGRGDTTRIRPGKAPSG